MNEKKYKVTLLVSAHGKARSRDEFEYETLEKAYEYAASWLKHQHDWAKTGWRVSLVIEHVKVPNKLVA